MVLRAESLRQRLLKLEEVTSRLLELDRDAPGDRSDFRAAWAVERGLLLAAEAVFDIGNHIISAHFGVNSTDYEDIIAQLAAQRVIDEPLRLRLKGLGGFRNILVHGYLRIDPTRVTEHLAHAPADFTAFAAQVRAWMAREVPGGGG